MADETAADIDIRAHTQLAFATPVIGYVWADAAEMNETLAALILQTEQNQSGMEGRSNVGGWHSPTDVFGWDSPAVGALKDKVEKLLGPVLQNLFADLPDTVVSYKIDGWANVLREGQYNTIHNHPSCFWSGIYYVNIGAPDPERRMSGDLEFVDPRSGANMTSPVGSVIDRGLRVRPQNGLMVMFPSWLKHFVHPYFGPGERISVAFNITCTGFRRAEATQGPPGGGA